VLEYQPFVQAVEAHLGVDDAEQVRAGIEAVLGAVDQVLDADARGKLAAALPGSLRSAISNASDTRTMTTEEFVGVVASLGGYPIERGRYWTQAVLAALAEQDPETADIVRPALPDAGLMAPLGQGPAPRGSGVATNRQPEMLTADEISRAVAAMPGWTGDERRLQRTIEIPAERVAPLTNAVHRIQKELDHHAQIDNTPAGLSFTIWTHTLDRVTDLDIQLAQRVDEAIRTVA
jgi:pterin-4a-carbinolamine dehydratase/uncharacterized protein (DUF2267 family)